MLESTEHVIYHAHYVKMPTIVGILIFITIIITTSESLKETSNFICYFLFKFSCPVEFLKKNKTSRPDLDPSYLPQRIKQLRSVSIAEEQSDQGLFFLFFVHLQVIPGDYHTGHDLMT